VTVPPDEWLAQLAARLGAPPPTKEEAEALLKIASLAAHASERMAAPLSCWLVARAGIDPPAALAAAGDLAEALGEAPQ